jgi:predicted lipid-binding transport protein (Tim44 family)
VRRLVATTVLFWLLLAATALAGAGGGSSGFGGGGGGGGGGGFSGGGGGGGSCTGSGCSVSGLVVLVIIGCVIVFVVIPGAWAGRRARAKRRERVRRVELASAEAAGDDEAFAADAVKAGATELFLAVQRAWDERDRATLRELVGPDLLVEWERRLDDFDRKGWHNRVRVATAPQISYMGLVNRADDADDRVTVHVSATMEDYVVDRAGNHITRNGQTSETTACNEFWTLGKRVGGGWRLLSIEQEAEGAHVLDAEIVATPWGDDQRLHDEAVAERAADEAAPPGFAPGELADLDFEGTARAAALDLALADGRFDPDLIEASVRRAVAAWAEAVDGEDAPLEAVARPEVVRELLHPGDAGAHTRLVVRGPRIGQVRISGLDAAATPPTIAVEVDVRGRRYVEDRDTVALVSGSRDRESAFTERWTLALEGPADWPWRLAAAGAPAPAG